MLGLKQPERRVVVVQNENSTRAKNAQDDINYLRDKGASFEVFWTPSADPERNIDDFSEFVRPGDFVYSAAGDGTANQIANAMLQAGVTRDTLLAFGPYGNFNDGARSFGSVGLADVVAGRYGQVGFQSIETHLNGERQPDTMFYSTIGWTAFVASKFISENRDVMRHSKAKTVRSLATAALAYATDRRQKLPEFSLNGTPIDYKYSDVLARNSPIMAKLIRGRDYTADPTVFGSRGLNVADLAGSAPYLLGSAIGQSPDVPTSVLQIDFEQARDTWFMQDGESRLVTDLAQYIALKRPNGPGLRVATKRSDLDLGA